MQHAARCWFLHQWSKWEAYQVEVEPLYRDRTPFMQTRERRQCQVCGKNQDRKVEGSL